MSCRLRSLAACVAAVAGAACGAESRAPQEAAPVPSAVQGIVGPLPGPAQDVQDRPNPVAGSEESLAAGRRYFVQYNCAGCHGDHGGGGMGPSLRDTVWLYGDTHERIAKSIAEGRNYGMPAWSRMLTEEQIWQITAYLKSMRTSDEPDAPPPY